MLRTERLRHYINQQYRRIGFDKAGSRDRRWVQAAKVADVVNGCKPGTVCKGKNVTISFNFRSVCVVSVGRLHLLREVVLQPGDWACKGLNREVFCV